VGLNVNDHHRLNEFGLELLTEYERGPQDGSVPLTPGGAAMEPYICPGDMLTIGYGCTKYFGGMEVLPTDRLSDEASARALLADQLIEYEAAVKRLVTVPLNSNQFSALVCFAFNCGINALGGSTLLKHVNANRFDDAADQFGAWLYSTSGKHKQALRGLLRRRYSEACLWMGYSWTVACADDAVALVRERPPGNVGTDRVLSKTQFKDVLSVAQRFALPPLDDELVLSTPIKAEPAVVPIASKAVQPAPLPGPASAGTAIKTSASGSSEAVSVKPTVPAPQPVPSARPAPAPVEAVKPPPLPKDAAPASIEPKDMVLSKRFWGLAVTAVGTTNFLPRGVSEWINNEGNRELLTWLVVVVIGFALYKYGQRKAKTDLK
jgi:lysozyme